MRMTRKDSRCSTTGGPAFPVTADNADRMCGANGMTLRDYFAAAAMQGWLASFGERDGHPADKPGGADRCARINYALADAMLKEKKSGDDVIANLEKEIESLHAELQCAEAIARATDGQDADDRKVIDEMELEIMEQRTRVDSLTVHLKRVIGDHSAPHDCFSTGPLTGAAADDLCPACEALKFLYSLVQM